MPWHIKLQTFKCLQLEIKHYLRDLVKKAMPSLATWSANLEMKSEILYRLPLPHPPLTSPPLPSHCALSSLPSLLSPSTVLCLSFPAQSSLRLLPLYFLFLSLSFILSLLSPSLSLAFGVCSDSRSLVLSLFLSAHAVVSHWEHILTWIMSINLLCLLQTAACTCFNPLLEADHDKGTRFQAEMTGIPLYIGWYSIENCWFSLCWDYLT